MRTRDRLVGILLAAALAILVGACSTSGSNGNPAGEPVATSTVDLPPSYRFEPKAISIPAGTTVTWTNHDNFTHSVKFLDGGLPSDPMLMPPGASTTFTFANPGTYAYECHLHPQDMRGTVTVTP